MLHETFTKSTWSLNNATCLEARWKTAAQCSDHHACVEARWKPAAQCGDGHACVECRTDGGMVQIRDSKLGDASPVLEFTPEEWVAFLGGANAGEFDLPT